jgi:hypothetical protein
MVVASLDVIDLSRDHGAPAIPTDATVRFLGQHNGSQIVPVWR